MCANTRLDSLSDLTQNRANRRVRCPCGAEHIFDANRFWRYAMLRRWSTQVGALGHHLRCLSCGKRGPRLNATPQAPTLADPFPRTEASWKALKRQLIS